MVNFWDAEKEIVYRENYTRQNFENDAKKTEILFRFLSLENQIVLMDQMIIVVKTKDTTKIGSGDTIVRSTWQTLVMNESNKNWLKSMPKERWKQIDKDLHSQAARLQIGDKLRLIRAKLNAIAGRMSKK